MSKPSCDFPTEYVEGEWCYPTHDSEPAAVITYTTDPSPETGHVGWVWWALGEMGEAPSMEAAKAAAVEALGRFVDKVAARKGSK